MGGECNYLLRVSNKYRLEFVSKGDWMSDLMLCWTLEDIRLLLDEAEAILTNTARHLRLPVEVRLAALILHFLVNHRAGKSST